MADITVTASAVVPANANTGIARGTAGATITAGQAVYADPADSFKIKPAASTNQTQSNNVVGIALDGASAGQPVSYAFSGDVTFQAAAFGAGNIYVLGTNAGGISTATDLEGTTNTRYGVVLGIASAANVLRMGVIISGVLNA